MSDVEEDADYEDDTYYYQTNDNELLYHRLENDEGVNRKKVEQFDYECITEEQAKSYLETIIQRLSSAINISASYCKLLLIHAEWNEEEIVESCKTIGNYYLSSKRLKPLNKPLINHYQNGNINSLEKLSYLKCANLNQNLNQNINLKLTKKLMCCICVQSYFITNHKALSCEHFFCKECWRGYLQMQITEGHATNIECMYTDCHILVPEDFVNYFFEQSDLREKYSKLSFRDCIESHPYLRACAGTNCSTIIKAAECKPKRVQCSQCLSTYCFKCGGEYHAPTDCKIIRLWLTKCADDSETAHYISANTKDCPNCSTCIEKNGGCNHMKCYACKFEFCWMCFGTWGTHGSQYYDCSRYRENPNIINETEKAREALKKYLFYYERWDNHMRSLRLESMTLEKIKEIIHDKVMSNIGTWIDWQYLLDASALLAKCRYTLQYTYPFAYYMEPGPNKTLFEYQQAKLEAEIENLSWKIENAEQSSRGEVENQMNIVEKRRTTLLEDFFL